MCVAVKCLLKATRAPQVWCGGKLTVGPHGLKLQGFSILSEQWTGFDGQTFNRMINRLHSSEPQQSSKQES